ACRSPERRSARRRPPRGRCRPPSLRDARNAVVTSGLACHSRDLQTFPFELVAAGSAIVIDPSATRTPSTRALTLYSQNPRPPALRSDASSRESPGRTGRRNLTERTPPRYPRGPPPPRAKTTRAG